MLRISRLAPPSTRALSELSILQVQAFSDRPGYERTSSSLWKQREEYCASLIQQAWRDYYKSVISRGVVGGL